MMLFKTKTSICVSVCVCVCVIGHSPLRVMLDIPIQYNFMHYRLILLCYCVRNRDHCCVLCDVARDLLMTWYIVYQPPLGLFRTNDQKQTMINEHNMVKNPNWREADQLAIYKHRREVELGATESNMT